MHVKLKRVAWIVGTMHRNGPAVRHLFALLAAGARAVVLWLMSVGSGQRKDSADSRTPVAAPRPTTSPKHPQLRTDPPSKDTSNGQHGKMPANPTNGPSKARCRDWREHSASVETNRPKLLDSGRDAGSLSDRTQFASRVPEQDLPPHIQDLTDADEPAAFRDPQHPGELQSPSGQAAEESNGDSDTPNAPSPGEGVPAPSSPSPPTESWDADEIEPEPSIQAGVPAAVPIEDKDRTPQPSRAAEAAQPSTCNRATDSVGAVAEQKTPPNGPGSGELHQPVPSGRPAHSPAPVSRYSPRLSAPGEAAKGKASADTVSPSTEPSIASLSAEIVVTFNPGDWGINLHLLLRRRDSMPEEMVVSVGNNIHELWAIDDEFFGAVPLENAEDALHSGIAAHADIENGAPTRWVRTGRGLYAFAPRPGIAGFVSVPRVRIGTENVVICTPDLVAQVTDLVRQTGSELPRQVDGPGIPDGWCCFRAIRPAHPLPEGIAGGPFLALSPRAEVEIEFEGGIRIERNRWLGGAPPSIRVIGANPHGQAISIDGQSAVGSEDSAYLADGWDALGAHTVECAGITRTYELVEPQECWQWWPAHCGNTLAVCGAKVSDMSGASRAVSCSEPSWLIGSSPGEVGKAVLGKGRIVAVSAPEFTPVWAIPIAARRRSQGYSVTLVGASSEPTSRIPSGSSKYSVKLWCSAIRRAAQLRLPTIPSDDETRMLFQEYKHRARQIARMLK